MPSGLVSECQFAMSPRRSASLWANPRMSRPAPAAHDLQVGLSEAPRHGPGIFLVYGSQLGRARMRLVAASVSVFPREHALVRRTSCSARGHPNPPPWRVSNSGGLFDGLRDELAGLRRGERGAFFATAGTVASETHAPNRRESCDDASPARHGFHNDPCRFRLCLLPRPFPPANAAR